MPFVYEEEFDPIKFVNIDDGMYRGRIFNIEKKTNKDGRYYEITIRIQGGEYDGEDVIERYVGLQGKALFRIYEILTALGVIDQYYTHGDKANNVKGRWHHLPAPEDLQGGEVFIKVEDDPFQAVKDGVPQFNDDSTPKMLHSPRITSYYSVKEPMPEFRPTKRKTPPAPSAAPQQGGFQGGGQPQQQGGWNAPAQAQPAQQQGGFQQPAQGAGPDPIW